MRILVTGAAGFIGFHLCKQLLDLGHEVVGLDNINDYYQTSLKYDRLKQLGIDNVTDNQLLNSAIYNKTFQFIKIGLEDASALDSVFELKFDIVCNLAAQAGVRYSLEAPQVYVESNIVGFVNLLESMRKHQVRKLVYASSSSVYGNSDDVPFKTTNNVDHPISLYAASKKANELIAHTYSHLFKIETIGLRFFTVYGPWGRPDMAMFLFTDALLKGKPINVFNNGALSRDFTYIDDIVKGVVATLLQNRADSDLYKIYNIGNGSPVQLLDFISALEEVTGVVAEKNFLPMQPGDVEKTWADSSDLERDYQYKPSTPVNIGVNHFVEWYKQYYQL